MGLYQRNIKFLIYFSGLLIVSNAGTYSNLKNLYQNITSGINKNIRPVLDQSDPVYVSFYFHLTYLQEFNEVDGKLSLTGYFGVHWIDQTVSWDTTEQKLDSFTYADNVFWKPTLIIANSYGETQEIYNDNSVKRVFSNGRMDWNPGGEYTVTCQADVSDYPFDTHLCAMQVLVGGYYDTEINIFPTADPFVTVWYIPHKTWELEETHVAKYDSPQGIYFYMKLKRKPIFFVLNLILPICLMSMLNVFVFLLPANCGERVGYAVTILLAIAVFLTISSDSLPTTSVLPP